MTLDQVIDEASARCSVDRQSQDNITLLRRWVNMTQQDMASRYEWPWLADSEAFATQTDSTTGTIAATAASKTITGTSTAFASTDVGRYINFSSSNDWYKIDAVASTTSLTLATAYAPATESGMTYTIRTLVYPLSANVDRVYDVRQYRTAAKLTQVSTRLFDFLLPNSVQTGNPTHYNIFYYRNPTSITGQQWALSFNPSPSAAMLIEVRFLKRLADLTLGTDISAVPQKWHHVLVDGATYLCYLWQSSDKTGGMRQIYEFGIQKMKEEAESSLDYHPVLKNFDVQGAGSRFLAFPGEFEQPY